MTFENSVQLDLDEVRAHVPEYTNEKLCDMIVCDRYFGFEESIYVICMEELSKRRTNGDMFDFETYIDLAQKELPVLDFSIPDIRSVLNQAINRKPPRQ
jgi:hypothetical protein